jgi:CheY-like chemotaxis protein
MEARHGREALATIEQHAAPIHLVLTDIKMPGMNGRAGPAHRRALARNPIRTCRDSLRSFQGGLFEPRRALPRRHSPRTTSRPR